MSRLAPSKSFSYLSQNRLADYTRVKAYLPVVEESMTQLGAGKAAVNVAVASAEGVSLLRVRPTALSVGVTIMDPAYTAFIFVAPRSGECLINGQLATPSTIHMPGVRGSLHIRGADRDVVGVAVPRRRLVETVAALRGVDPEDVALDEAVLQLSAPTVTRMHAQLAATLDRYCRGNSPATPADFASEVLERVSDAYLLARPDPAPKRGGTQRLTQIVRKAEERFAAAEGSPVSLADLCAAAGVGKSVLYEAFDRICGVSPLAYFHKRRLMRARSVLLNSPPVRSAVKRAALDAGLTELGRFSVEYRRLFGELPSVTVSRVSAR